MAKTELFIFLTFAALILANEVEEVDQKKRGAGKGNSLNSIPTGAQKPEYTYNIYPQSLSNIPSQNYQTQIPNSYYPSQDSSTYYTPANTVDASNVQHSQANYSPQPVQSQFVPINFIPSPGYQSKYQLLPTKASGNIQLAILQQPSYSPPIAQYPQNLFSQTPSSQITPPNIPLLNSFGTPGHYGLAPNFQPVSLGNHAISQPSMILLPQSNPSLYNNFLYPNPSQSFYNYYQNPSQAKYSYSSGASVGASGEYEKAQTTVAQSIPKEDNDVSIQGSEYTAPLDTNSGYKSSYSRRSTYSKLK